MALLSRSQCDKLVHWHTLRYTAAVSAVCVCIMVLCLYRKCCAWLSVRTTDTANSRTAHVYPCHAWCVPWLTKPIKTLMKTNKTNYKYTISISKRWWTSTKSRFSWSTFLTKLVKTMTMMKIGVQLTNPNLANSCMISARWYGAIVISAVVES